ncbi:hypothetical protein KKC88_02920 [Patescibacteria group bacterium]|nr:hypothetical protein [Patescibacteria group bacterium]MBU1673824.1 hypothetical protein [Patescibacteria group bacterium]MBU1964071.1 hypothetical protein [Patescibacteria group bacterium]
MKKYILIPTSILIFSFLFASTSGAQVNQESEIQNKVRVVKVKKLSKKDNKIRTRVSWKAIPEITEYQVQLLKKCKTCEKKYKKVKLYTVENPKTLKKSKRPYKIIKRKVGKYIKNKKYGVRVRTIDGKWSEKVWFVSRQVPPKCKTPKAPSSANPTSIVGNGTAASCSEQAFKDAVAQGGIIKFDCGPEDHTIVLTSVAKANTSKDTIIDGEKLITLSGGSTTRILELDTGNFELTAPTLTVKNLIFRNGRSTASNRYNDDGDYLGADQDGGGGAIFFYGGKVKSFNNKFYNNHCPDWGPDLAGGGIYGIGEGRMVIVNNRFKNNTCANGGAVGGLHTSIKIYNSSIIKNKALGKGANYQDENNVQQGHGGNGGGILMDGDEQDFLLCGSTVSQNTANALGGAMFRTTYQGRGTMKIKKSLIKKNRVTDKENPNNQNEPAGAGGIYFQGGPISIKNTTILKNSAPSFGGMQLADDYTTINFNKVKFLRNVSRQSLAGGIYIGPGVTGKINNSSISYNKAPSAFAAAIAGGGESGIVLKNTKILHNTSGNHWNPMSCQNSFIDGGGNYQFPVVRPNGESDFPDYLCSANITVKDINK